MLNDPNDVKKKGQILGKKYLKESTLPMDPAMKEYPISYNLEEKKPNGVKKPQGNLRKFDALKSVSNTDFKIYLPPSEAKDYVYLPRKPDPFYLPDP